MNIFDVLIILFAVGVSAGATLVLWLIWRVFTDDFYL